MGRLVSIIVSLACLLVFINPVTAFAEHRDYSQPEIQQTIENAIDWKKSANKNAKGNLISNEILDNAGTEVSDWYGFAVGRLGIQDDTQAYLEMVKQNITKRYKSEGQLDDTKATEWHRIALAVLSVGGDPTQIGTDSDRQPINLIADGVYYRGRTKPLSEQGINGLTWGLTVLDSMRYKTPADAIDTRDTIVPEILALQLKDGGFSLDGEQTDVDITAMTLQSLAPYYNSEQIYTYVSKWNNKKMKASVRHVVDQALECLSTLQMPDGDYSSWGVENAESTCQVLIALSALGIDPLTDQRFIKGENTVLDGIMKYRSSDGGFIHSSIYDEENLSAEPDKSNSMASEQTLRALTAYYRYLVGYRALYDFRPEMTTELKEKIAQLNQDIIKIKNSGKQNISTIESLFDRYMEVPIEERCYVYSYRHLAEMMSDANLSNTSEYLAAAMNITEKGNGAVTDFFNTGSGIYEDYLFTDRDYQDYKSIPEQPATAYYSQVIALLGKISNARNAEEYPGVMEDLEVKKAYVEAVLEKIDELNELIMETLYPFEKLGIADKKSIDQIVKEIQSLQDADQAKVMGYEDVIRVKTQIDSQLRALVIGISVFIMALVLISVVVYRIKKKRKERLPDYEDDEDLSL